MIQIKLHMCKSNNYPFNSFYEPFMVNHLYDNVYGFRLMFLDCEALDDPRFLHKFKSL